MDLGQAFNELMRERASIDRAARTFGQCDVQARMIGVIPVYSESVLKKMRENAESAIAEYLDVARRCIGFRKPGGGCLGYPGTLLLLCTINAIGVFESGESVQLDGHPAKITRGEPFRVLNHADFGLGLTGKQIKTVEKSFRNLLAHNASLPPDHLLISTQPALPGLPPFTFEASGAWIHVNSLLLLVEGAWQRFDKR